MSQSLFFLPKRRTITLMIVAYVFVLDQLSKWWIVSLAPPEAIETGGVLLKKISPFFNLVLLYNKGFTFGFFGDSVNNLFVLVIVVVLLVVVVFLMRQTEPIEQYASLAFVFGGGLSNAVDRLHRPGVVDFLDFHWGDLHWPSFNVADIMIVMGLAGFLIFGLLNGLSGAGQVSE